MRRGRPGCSARYAAAVNGPEDTTSTDRGDDGRAVEFDVEDAPLLPEQTGDDTDRGWGDWSWSNDDRLIGDRPPHWDQGH